MADPLSLPWRTGRHVGRTIYSQISPDPSDGDVLIGVMDTRELAAEACEAHNRRLQVARIHHEIGEALAETVDLGSGSARTEDRRHPAHRQTRDAQA